MALVLIASPLPHLPHLVHVATNQHMGTNLSAGSTGHVPYQFISVGCDDLDPERDEQSTPNDPSSCDGVNLRAVIRSRGLCLGRKLLPFCVILVPFLSWREMLCQLLSNWSRTVVSDFGRF